LRDADDPVEHIAGLDYQVRLPPMWKKKK